MAHAAPGRFAACVGCLVDSDGTCPQCQEHFELFCPGATFTCNAPDNHLGGVTFGGCSERVVGLGGVEGALGLTEAGAAVAMPGKSGYSHGLTRLP